MVLQDLRFAVRTLQLRPGFPLVIVATLALGIGANTAIFSVLHAVVLKPLPFRDPDRLMHIWESYPKGSRYRQGAEQSFIIVRPGTYFDWKRQARSFMNMTACSWRSVLLTGGSKAEMLEAHEVDEDFFATVRVAPILGRAFQQSDFKSGTSRIVILSFSLWTQRFGADPAIVGKTILLDNAKYLVRGVMPEGFYPTRWQTPQLWLPMYLDPELKQSRVVWKFFTFARLKTGISFEQAHEELDVISDRLTAAYPSNYDNMCAVLTPVTGYLFSQYERLFLVLLGAVTLVLLIACSNVSNLLLARAAERRKELTVRAALGASRRRLVQLLLTESLLLSAGGGLLGTMVALAGIHPILALLPAASRVPRIDEVRIDGSALAFTACISALTVIFFGVIPAHRASQTDLNEDLKESGRGSSSSIGLKRTSELLIVGEVALSLVLLVCAGLLIRSFRQLLKTNPGFHPDQVVAFSLSVPTHHYGNYETGGPNASRARLFEELERRLKTLPGVNAAVVTGSLPLRHGPNPWAMHIVGKPAPPNDRTKYGGAARNRKTGLYNHGDVSIQRVTPGYFDTFGIPLLRGRYFTARDTAGGAMVAIINETNARKHFGADDPIGRTIILDMTSYFPKMTVVGVVADSRLNALDRDVYPEVFWPMAQWPSANGWVAVKTSGSPQLFTKSVESTISGVDRDLAINEVVTMNQVLADSVWRQRLTASLLGTFALLAAILAGAGIYSLFWYFVNRRVKELGIRLALGASRQQIMTLVVGLALKLAWSGIVIGVVFALAAGRLVSAWLYGVQIYDARTIGGAALGLLLTAMLASYIPALRATRIDPLASLRQE